MNHADTAINLVLGVAVGCVPVAKDDYTRTAKIWSGILANKLKADITAEEAILMMVGLKLSRESHTHKDDNIIDAHGYLLCYEWAKTGVQPTKT